MNGDALQTVFTCAGPLQWVHDKEGVIIVAEPTRTVYTLRGVEAALWGWLMLGYPYGQIVELLAALLCLPPGAGEQALAGILENWRGQGLLQREESADG